MLGSSLFLSSTSCSISLRRSSSFILHESKASLTNSDTGGLVEISSSSFHNRNRRRSESNSNPILVGLLLYDEFIMIFSFIYGFYSLSAKTYLTCLWFGAVDGWGSFLFHYICRNNFIRYIQRTLVNYTSVVYLEAPGRDLRSIKSLISFQGAILPNIPTKSKVVNSPNIPNYNLNS